MDSVYEVEKAAKFIIAQIHEQHSASNVIVLAYDFF